MLNKLKPNADGKSTIVEWNIQFIKGINCKKERGESVLEGFLTCEEIIIIKERLWRCSR